MAFAVICEFNPFHNGHRYLLNKIKQNSNEPIIAIMSGSFTQRGEVAITDKYQRAESALKNGADLVVELPVVYATSCAQRFAKAGVHIASSFSCVDKLAFGCENDNIDQLNLLLKAKQSTDVHKIVKKRMSEGDYYPRAFAFAVQEVFGNVANLLKSANNILALEYINEIKGRQIKPMPIKRIGVGHDSKMIDGSYASASAIREILRKGQLADEFMPSSVNNVTNEMIFESAMLYRLRTMTKQELEKLPEVSEGLENRIFDAVRNYNTINEIAFAIKTKRYTLARIRRILTYALLEITENLQNTPIEYVRVLGFSSKGAELLKTCKLNVVTSASNGIKLGGNTQLLLSKDILASDILALAYNQPQQAGLDYTTPIIKI